ncbi:MAG: GNAT family N-acetyltransferase, partial [Oscillospiraceae bacterium]
TALFAAAEKALPGAQRWVLEVRESNEKAISLYKKLGFENAGMRKNFYSKPVENGIIMIKVMGEHNGNKEN